MVNNVSNQTVHHQSSTQFASMLEDIKNHKPVKLLEYLLHFWYSAKKSIVYIFNHDNTGGLIISLLNNVIEKELKLGKQNVKTDEWLSNLCKAVKTKHWPIQSAFFLKKKNTQNTLAMKKILRKTKKTHNYQYVWICDLLDIGSPVVKVKNLYWQFF